MEKLPSGAAPQLTGPQVGCVPLRVPLGPLALQVRMALPLAIMYPVPHEYVATEPSVLPPVTLPLTGAVVEQ